MPSKTRSEYIAILKTRGKRGKLSKMRKADLKRLVVCTRGAPRASDPHEAPRFS